MSQPTLTPDDRMADHVRRRFMKKTGKEMNFLSWSLKVPEPKAGVLDFDRFPFQLELYGQSGAMDPEMVVKKATQVGISAWLLRWAIYHADTRRQTALYIFPKRKQMYDFADARMKAAIMGSPYLRTRIAESEVSNKGLKQIGLGWLYARGSESKADLDSVDADVLCLDEYDTLRQENIPDAERRISGSLNGLIRRVGVPSLPGYGIDRLYELTDKRRWNVKCGCGDEQPLTFKANVDLETATLVCRKCRKRLDPSGGRWVATHPDRDVKGYHLPRLIVPGLDLAPIIKAHRQTNPNEITTHQNKDLAEAYAPEEGRLSDSALDGATRPDIPREAVTLPQCDVVTMGVDVASVRALNVRVSAYTLPEQGLPRKVSLYIGAVDDFGKVVELMERFNVNMCCVDHEPEHRLARALVGQFPGRVYLAHFITSRSQLMFNPDPDMATVGVKRTQLLDATFDAIRQQRNLLPAELPEGYREQMQALNRVLVEKPHGKIGEYHSVAQDDYAFAEAYDTLALQVYLWQGSVSGALEGETMGFAEMYDWEPSQLQQVDDENSDSFIDAYEPGFGDEGGLDSYDMG